MQPQLSSLLKNVLKSAHQVLPLDGLQKKLEGKDVLKIKFGADPTAPDLHLGHVVVLQALRELQNLGHEIIFLIGDFTAQIGDPSGKSKTRPPLEMSEIKKNAETYFKQVGRILDLNTLTIKYNSEWLSKFSFSDVLNLAGKITVARLLERDDFFKRWSEQTPIGFHELFYPLMQGYDSIALDADVEVGGTDQTFNLLMGRFLQEQYGKEPQTIITFPLLLGLDGVQKMSKSLGNYVALNDAPEMAYGKLMSISDELMWSYFEILLHYLKDDLIRMKQDVESGAAHPMKLKKQMAFEIVAKYWSHDEAERGQQQFEALFQNHDYSQAQEVLISEHISSPVWIIDLLKEVGAIKGSSEGKRLLESNAISLDEVTITDFKAEVEWQKGSTLKVGKKRIYKLM